MKKLLTIALLLLACLTVSAQGWTTADYAGDELKGTAPYTAYLHNERKKRYILFELWHCVQCM